jgi:DNA helicase-2/ATP-dependent DNA helicase PcrA
LRFYADLHVHSKYSRATSRDCDLEHLALYAKRKGISVVGTGDFTHPAWWQEIQDNLVPAEPGLWQLKPELERAVDARLPPACRREVRFLLEVEISTIYKKGDATRKVHHLIYAGEMATAARFRDKLGTLGNIKSDGRPILGLDSRHLLEVTLESGSDAYLIPAHIWTPWFSMLGSKSGFDTVEECYGDLAGHIFALETGLSSDPPMNWRVSRLDGYTLVSNSDAHSPPMLGREACVFVGELDYYAMRRSLETGEGWGGTVEFFPEEGKYHLDGHRACEVCCEPDETRRLGGICPVCKKPLTVGVLHRVETLADRPTGDKPERIAPFRSLVQLPQLVAEIHGVGVKSKAVEDTLQQLAARVGPELELIDQAPLEEVRRLTHPLLAEALDRLRRGKVRCEGGYDGEYGVIRVFEPGEVLPQLSMVSLLGLEMPEPAPKRKSLPAELPLFAPAAPAEKPAKRAAFPDRRPLLERLDPFQRAAAEALSGPLLIVAGPGAGKTRTLTHRLAHLIEKGADARRCLAITFTRRAAAELGERLEALLGERARGIAVRTFHGLGFDILRAEHQLLELPAAFRIADAALAAEILGGRFALSKSEARRTFEALGAARRRRLFGGRVDGELPRISIETYRSLLADAGYVDLEDLLMLPVELLDDEPERAAVWQQRFDHLAVDEYQDVDPVQYRLLRQLVPASGNICAIGDPDQSIYRFRGAEVSFFLRFGEDFPGARTVTLENNYRSQPAIVEAARLAVAPGTLLPGRRLEPASGKPAAQLVLLEGEDEKDEASLVVRAIEQLLGGLSHFSLDSGRIGGDRPLQQVSFDDIAILYRTGGQAAHFEEALGRLGIPYQRRSHERLIERDEVRWLLHHLTLLRDQGARPPGGGEPTVAEWLRFALASAPHSGTSQGGAPSGAKLEAALELLGPLAQKRGAELDAFLGDLATGAEVDTWDPRAERVSLLTLHASKGLEFPVVFLAGCDDGLLPFRYFSEETDLGEERRLFFVGITRAQDQLYFSRARRRSFRGETRSTQPSPYLQDIPPRLFEKQAPPPRPPKKVEPKVEQLGLF